MRICIGVFFIFSANLTFAMEEPCSTDSERQGLRDEPIIQALFGPSQSILDCVKLQSLNADRLRLDADYFDSSVADSDFRNVLPPFSDGNVVKEAASPNSSIGVSRSFSNIENGESENQIRTVRGYSSKTGSDPK